MQVECSGGRIRAAGNASMRPSTYVDGKDPVTAPGGRKDDQDKNRLDLLPFEALEVVGQVMTYGAKKYGTETELTQTTVLPWLNSVLSQGTSISGLSRSGCVVRVTNGIYETLTPNTRRGSEQIVNDGLKLTPNEVSQLVNCGKPTRIFVAETRQQNVAVCSEENTGSLLSSTTLWYEHKDVDARSALDLLLSDPLTSITVTLQTGCVVCSAADAITLSDILRTLWLGLQKHSIISMGFTATPNATAIAKSTGDHNWRKGMAWHRLFGAALRHLWAWYRGEKADPETGLSHLAHAACCVLFLLTYELKGLGTDDRPTT
jgi:hypothetical protein